MWRSKAMDSCLLYQIRTPLKKNAATKSVQSEHVLRVPCNWRNCAGKKHIQHTPPLTCVCVHVHFCISYWKKKCKTTKKPCRATLKRAVAYVWFFAHRSLGHSFGTAKKRACTDTGAGSIIVCVRHYSVHVDDRCFSCSNIFANYTSDPTHTEHPCLSWWRTAIALIVLI